MWKYVIIISSLEWAGQGYQVASFVKLKQIKPNLTCYGQGITFLSFILCLSVSVCYLSFAFPFYIFSLSIWSLSGVSIFCVCFRSIIRLLSHCIFCQSSSVCCFSVICLWYVCFLSLVCLLSVSCLKFCLLLSQIICLFCLCYPSVVRLFTMVQAGPSSS